MIQSGLVISRSAGFLTSPWMNSTPPLRKRGTFSSEPRRFRLSRAITRLPVNTCLRASAQV